MCGIYLSIGCGVDAPKPNDILASRLQTRGPDAHRVFENHMKAAGHPWVSTRFEGTVLALRGDSVVAQPVQPEDATNADFSMCWNGEAWGIDGKPVVGSDTEDVFKMMLRMLRMVSRGTSGKHSELHILETLSRVRGPYAFVFLDFWHSKVYFARDCLGRRSLLFKCNADSFVLSSVGDGDTGWEEVESSRLYTLDLNALSTKPAGSVLDRIERASDTVINAIRAAGLPVEISIQRFPWSKGLFQINTELPTQDATRLTEVSPSVAELERHLRHSLGLRLNLPDHDMPVPYVGRGASVAILFSGGLDCSVLARLAHDVLPPYQSICLLNVAFQNPRIHGNTLQSNDTSVYETCPDRITARKSLSELRQVCPTRDWRLVEINVPYTSVQERKSHIASLLKPHDTEMDMSIGLALYFAARGIGTVDGQAYASKARVLLSGLGADELFGGYQRHATAFQRGGYKALIAELTLDTARLGKRNLGRDDRVIADLSREARYPYLDEQLVEWAAQAPVWEKCGFRERSTKSADEADSIEPGKLVLRLLADRLGLPGIAREKKRAIQFGAKTAKMEKGKTRGTDAIA